MLSLPAASVLSKLRDSSGEKKGSLNSFDSSLRWICPLLKETLVPLYFASLLHDFYEEEKKKIHLPGFVQYLILTVMLLTKLYIV